MFPIRVHRRAQMSDAVRGLQRVAAGAPLAALGLPPLLYLRDSVRSALLLLGDGGAEAGRGVLEGLVASDEVRDMLLLAGDHGLVWIGGRGPEGPVGIAHHVDPAS